ncbi:MULTISPECIES: APC family permease [Pseudomonas]|uniref:Amino acid/polyamine/organocation transporter, APC superfamily n=1 Tax=Pseudomonas fluorescens (strain Pf0-1) TaxID=205922 RepID=Q3K7G1_PSEPF|nr:MULTISPECIES: APC family permease [Pseudomonas]ABA76293.1 amino acid/polyamine/organocation transporter, APC superfamily [Pseudomonas fluorescens Pf0-1]MBL0794152.1 APC family permease [Pseudomonas sp. B7]MBX8623067.1 APC family permease [Pseudomonas glycinae]MBY9024222.1 APC family permease [Pseudomonas fluorescens]MBY9030535.1 APC family permease [Pseudomonas fluorescens]
MARLQRTLSLGSVVLFGIAYMTPIIVLGTFGILAQSTAGMVPAAYLAALVAMFFTAMSYGRMAAAFPVAGSAYSYVRKAISPKLGFIAGWAVLLDYLFLPMAIWLIGAAYLASAFPSIPQWIWVLAFIGITSAINIIGLKLANGINALLMLVQFLVLIAFVGLCVHYVGGDASQPLWSIKPFFNGDMQMPLIMSGAAIACYSFLGFDAVSTLTEETRDPRRTIPRAIMLITLIGGLIFVGVSYFVQIAHPSFQFDSVDSAAYEIARNIGGDLFVSIFLIGLIVGQFASGLSAQASGSRLLFAMGRDGVLPKSFFGTLHERFGTPVNSILLCAVVALLALKLDVTTSTSFINFGAFLAFSLVNLSVIFHYWIGGEKKGLRELILFLIFPFIGLAADLWLMVSLDHLAVYLGLSWLAIGVVYLAVLTGGFRRQPPEMDFQEAA